MPIYEYACRDCGHELEALQKISEPPLTECPDCHASALHKKVSAAAFRLAGGGWYETDFKSDGKRNLAGDGKDSKDGAGKAESGEGKAADAKAKPKPEAASKPAKSEASA